MKSATTIKSYLHSFTLTSTAEKNTVKHAIDQLHAKVDETRVLSELCSSLRTLAVKQEISKEGLDLLTSLQKPNFGNDVGRTFNLWF